MKQLFAIFFLCIFFSSNAQKPDFELNNFHLLWGKSRHQNAKDLSAKCKIFSDSNQVILEIEVLDETLVLKPDSIHSDHVEIWISPMTEESYKTRQFEMDGYVLEYYGDLNWQDAQKELLQKYNEFIKTGESEKETENDTLRLKDIHPHYNFWGMVHYGFYPDNRNPVLFDAKRYAENKPFNALQNINYKANFTDSGYRIRVVFPPAALGFLKAPEIRSLKILVDVIDVDEFRQESLISNSKTRKWGDISSFPIVYFKKPIQFNPTKIPDKSLQIFMENLDLQPLFLQDENGNWISQIWKNDLFLLDYRYYIDDFLENNNCDFPIEYQKKKIGEFEIDQFSFYNDNLHAYDYVEQFIIVEDQVIKSSNAADLSDYEIEFPFYQDSLFLFPDSTLGIQTYSSHYGSSYGWGACGGGDFHTTTFYKLKDKKLITLIEIGESSCTHGNFIGEMSLGDLLEIEEMIWNESRSKLTLKLYDSETFYEITWKKDWTPVIQKY